MERIDFHPQVFVHAVKNSEQYPEDSSFVHAVRSGVYDQLLETMEGNGSIDSVISQMNGLCIALDEAHGTAAHLQINPDSRDSVTFFGSARCKSDHSEYERIHDLMQEIARKNLITLLHQGGNGGLMEAASIGARKGGAQVAGHVPVECPDGSGVFDESGWGIHGYNDFLVKYLTYDGRLGAMTAGAGPFIVSTALGGGTLEEMARLFRQNQYGDKRGIILFGEEGAGKKLSETFDAMLQHGAISTRQRWTTDPTEEGMVLFAGSDGQKVEDYLRAAPWKKDAKS